MADAFLARLDFDTEERESILKLIRLHLEMSNALRRDIFDPEMCAVFLRKSQPTAAENAHHHDLRRYQGSQSDALTPWKAENLWQFYMSTANFMDRSVDEVRYHAAIDPRF